MNPNNTEHHKISSIAKHIMEIYFNLAIHSVALEVTSDEEKSSIMASGEIKQTIDPTYIDELNAAFNIKRSIESEDYYNNLLDVEYSDNDKRIIGSMIDYGKAEIKDDQLEIVIIRKRVK